MASPWQPPSQVIQQQTHSETSVRWLSLKYVEIILSSASMIANSQTLKCIFGDLDDMAKFNIIDVSHPLLIFAMTNACDYEVTNAYDQKVTNMSKK